MATSQAKRWAVVPSRYGARRLPTVPWYPGTQDVFRRVIRGLLLSELARRTGCVRGVCARSRALVFREACVLQGVVTHHGPPFSCDVSAKLDVDERGSSIRPPRSTQVHTAVTDRGQRRQGTAQEDETISRSLGRSRRGDGRTLSDTVDRAMVENGCRIAKDEVRIPLDVAVPEILRARVGIECVLVADKATVVELLSQPLRHQGNALSRFRWGTVLERDVGRGNVVARQLHGAAGHDVGVDRVSDDGRGRAGTR